MKPKENPVKESTSKTEDLEVALHPTSTQEVIFLFDLITCYF